MSKYLHVVGVTIFIGAMFGCSGPELDRIDLFGINMDNGELVLVKGHKSQVFYDAYDAEGKDWFRTSSDYGDGNRKQKWSIDKPSVVDLESYEWVLGGAYLTGKMDWFDVIPDHGNFADGYEPSATLGASYGEKSDTLLTRMVMDTSGRWEFSIAGTLPRTINLIQVGRLIACVDDDSCVGEIRDNTFTLSFDGYDLNGLYSLRDRVEGSFTDTQGTFGLWSASRH